MPEFDLTPVVELRERTHLRVFRRVAWALFGLFGVVVVVKIILAPVSQSTMVYVAIVGSLEGFLLGMLFTVAARGPDSVEVSDGIVRFRFRRGKVLTVPVSTAGVRLTLAEALPVDAAVAARAYPRPPYAVATRLREIPLTAEAFAAISHELHRVGRTPTIIDRPARPYGGWRVFRYT